MVCSLNVPESEGERGRRMATTKIPEELFDLVDENCKPLGVTKARSLVHRDG